MSDAQLSFRKSANIDRVTDKRKDSLFRLVDTDGSGTIDAQEFAVLYDAIKKDLAEELEKEAELQKEASSARRRFKMLLLFVAVLVSFLAASVAANFAVIFTVVDQAITTTTTSTGVLEVKGADTIAKTAIATQDVPLVVAPALDMETLGTVKSLAVTYGRGSAVVEAQLSVVGMRKHNNTFVEFISNVPGETVEVLNGAASLVRYPTVANGLTQPTKFKLCGANATCSAFRASGIDVDAALEIAKADLLSAGFGDASRSLQPWYDSSCYTSLSSSTWVPYIVCDQDAGTTQGACDSFGNTYLSTIKEVWALYFDPASYTGVRHFVFFAHGIYGNAAQMWDYYCTINSNVCPALQKPHFAHLIFVWASSIEWCTIFNGFSWSTTVFDPTTYQGSADAIASLLCDAGTTGSAASTWDLASCGSGIGPYLGMVTDHTTEMMLVGFSNGGGLGLYLNWKYSSFVTKAVAVDYWGYADYANWIPTVYNAAPSAGAVDLNVHVWTNCATGYYQYGSYNNNPAVAISDAEAIFTTVSFWDTAGLSVASPGGTQTNIVYSTPPEGGTGATNTYAYDEFYWVGTQGKFVLSVHGFGGQSSCTSYMSGVAHGDTPSYADVLYDIEEWIAQPPSPPPPLPPPPPNPPNPITDPPVDEHHHCVVSFDDFLKIFKYNGGGNLCLQRQDLLNVLNYFGMSNHYGKWMDYDCDRSRCLDPLELYNMLQCLFQGGEEECACYHCDDIKRHPYYPAYQKFLAKSSSSGSGGSGMAGWLGYPIGRRMKEERMKEEVEAPSPFSLRTERLFPSFNDHSTIQYLSSRGASAAMIKTAGTKEVTWKKSLSKKDLPEEKRVSNEKSAWQQESKKGRVADRIKDTMPDLCATNMFCPKPK